MACSRLEVHAFPRAISSQNTLTRPRAPTDRPTDAATRLSQLLVCLSVHGSHAGNKSALAAALVEIRCNRACRNCAKKINAGHLYHLCSDTDIFSSESWVALPFSSLCHGNCVFASLNSSTNYTRWLESKRTVK